MEKTIFLAYRVQRWFQHHHGLALAKMRCEECSADRIFTIWIDGTYRCMRCLFQASVAADAREGAPPSSDEVSSEFVAMWEEYCKRFDALPPKPEQPAVTVPSGLKVAPEPICLADICPDCEARRPHVLRPDGKSRCLYCMMRYVRANDVQPVLPRRTTSERLDYAASVATRNQLIRESNL
jgi:hypothetical protein